MHTYLYSLVTSNKYNMKSYKLLVELIHDDAVACKPRADNVLILPIPTARIQHCLRLSSQEAAVHVRG